MNYDEIFTETRRLLSQTLGRDLKEGECPSRQTEPKWDSLKHVELLFSIEDQFGIRFGGEEMAALDSLPKLVSAVEQQIASRDHC